MSPRNVRTPQQLSLQSARMVQLCLLISICLYAFVGERTPHPARTVPGIFLPLYAILAAALIVGAFAVRGKMVQSSLAALQRKPDDAKMLGRWRSGTMLTLIFCEAIGLLGFALRSVGYTRSQAAPFYIVAIILMIVWTPRLSLPPSASS